jgi:hypothetical protein
MSSHYRAHDIEKPAPKRRRVDPGNALCSLSPYTRSNTPQSQLSTPNQAVPASNAPRDTCYSTPATSFLDDAAEQTDQDGESWQEQERTGYAAKDSWACGDEFGGSCKAQTGTTQHQGSDTGCSTAVEGLVCFGMLVEWSVNVTLENFTSPGRPNRPVRLHGQEILSMENKGKVGHLHTKDAAVLGALHQQDSITLQCYCQGVRVSKNKTMHLSVIIYGPETVCQELVDFLKRCEAYLDRELFLQDPIRCNWNVPYRNPQSLWFDDPDQTRMTHELEVHDAPEIETIDKPRDILADLEACYDLPEASEPSALETPLYKHQRQALAFMQRREQGWDFSGKHLDLWRAYHDTEEGLVYRNAITGEEAYEHPAPFRGGILADQMGLGKTLSIIALIASDQTRSQPMPLAHEGQASVNATLVVVRAPCTLFRNTTLWQITNRSQYFTHGQSSSRGA